MENKLSLFAKELNSLTCNNHRDVIVQFFYNCITFDLLYVWFINRLNDKEFITTIFHDTTRYNEKILHKNGGSALILPKYYDNNSNYRYEIATHLNDYFVVFNPPEKFSVIRNMVSIFI